MEKENVNIKNEIISFLKEIVICFLLVFLMKTFILMPVQVRGESMLPTLKDKELAFSNLIGYRVSGLERFDIAIIRIEEKDEYIVKRVIGLPGETLSYKNEQLYINGEPVAETFFNEEYRSQFDEFTEDIGPVTLGEDEYFCLGDNRVNSSDSRVYGPFKKEKIASKGLFAIWPFSEMGVHTW
ncbi:MAG: signal peptidase I [Solobacterium sp.]|nr:signal peptidase I [Solobacterium sp.]